MFERFEARRQPLLPRSKFVRRLMIYAGLAAAIIAVSLLIGLLGYHFIEGLPWIDALLNASMLLGGMGPVNEMHTNGGKVFASFYALFSGMVLLVAVGVLISPIFHRMLHSFHLETPEEEDDDTEGGGKTRNKDDDDD